MNTTFLINGGAGRVVTSIPALEKYERLNPQDDFRILVHGWDQLFWSHPTLQKRTFNAISKGVFEQHIKNYNVVCPEPYQLYNFFNQKLNLAEAFDEIINKTDDHSDLNYNCLHLTTYEKNRACDYISNLLSANRKSKIVVFQPFGSGAHLLNGQPIDPSCRSFLQEDYFKVVKNISSDTIVLYASQPQLRHPSDSLSVSFDEQQPYLRNLISLISQCDYFVGVCSVGQHIARALNKPGLSIMGGTSENNFSYPDHLSIYRKKDRQPVYSPWRVSDADVEFSDRMNDGIMNFTEAEIQEISTIIKQGVSGNTTSTKENLLSEFTQGVSYG